MPADRGLAGALTDSDRDQSPDVLAEDLPDAPLHLVGGFVVAPAEPAVHALKGLFGCAGAESQAISITGLEKRSNRCSEAPTSASSEALPGFGRRYSETPSALEACSVRTWRSTRRSAPHPLAISAESS